MFVELCVCICVLQNRYIETLFFIIIRHELGSDRPVSASSISFLKRLPSRLGPFGLQVEVCIIVSILLLFIHVTYRNKFDLYLLSLSSTVSTFCSSKVGSFLLWSKSVYLAVLIKNFISLNVKLLFPPFH